MTEISFVVYGEPAPQGSKTAGRSKTGKTYMREDNPHTEPWRNAVAAAAAAAMNGTDLLLGPLRLDVTFVFARHQTHYGTGRNAGRLKPSAPIYRTATPDLDKLLRAIGDALSGIVFLDDRQVAHVVASKMFGTPSAEITVSQLDAQAD